jgi:hypothetical protein
MEKLYTCPVCLNADSLPAQILEDYERFLYCVTCPVCGKYDLDPNAYVGCLSPQSKVGSELTPANRARMAHRLFMSSTDKPQKTRRLTSGFISQFIQDGCPGPTPAQQATNAIRFVGTLIDRTGTRIGSLPSEFFAIIGAPNPTFAGELLLELKARGLVDGHERRATNVAPGLLNVGLTLEGWRVFEEEAKGLTAGKYGFFALKFGDPSLDALAKDLIKPVVRHETGFDVVDMRDIAQAGVIDNIMRAQIRDAAFVIVDLTHDNSGAYWEAGYAEGLGKPVIYICEKQKFDKVQTHFDTNHCTTVVWSEAEPEQFKQQLVATIRRSLNLF